jgi:putative ABC transport system permease protein
VLGRTSETDAGLSIAGLRTMDDQIEETIKNERMIGVLALVFGGLATLLAGVGLYGVLAYTTVQRTREIGIRIALGSTRLAISGLVAKEMLRLGAIGVLVALPCAVLLGRTLRSQLYGVSAADPFTLAGVVLLMGLVGLAAALVGLGSQTRSRLPMRRLPSSAHGHARNCRARIPYELPCLSLR